MCVYDKAHVMLQRSVFAVGISHVMDGSEGKTIDTKD